MAKTNHEKRATTPDPKVPSGVVVSHDVGKFGKVTRYRLPSGLPTARFYAIGRGCLGIAFFAMPVAFALFMLAVVPKPPMEFVLFFSFGYCVVFVPLGIFMFASAAFALYGHYEIIVDDRSLRTIARLSVFSHARSIALDQICGCRVKIGLIPREATAANKPITYAIEGVAKYATLVADRTGRGEFAICFGYEAQWLFELANLLAACHLAHGRAPVAMPPQPAALRQRPIGLLPTTVDYQNPAVVMDRPNRPSTSNAMVTTTEGGLTIYVPPKGFVAKKGPFLAFAAIWTLAIPIGITLVILILLGKITTNNGSEVVPPAGALIVIPFILIGCAMAWAIWYGGKKSETFEVSDGRLRVREGLANATFRQWSVEAIRDIRVVTEFRTSVAHQGGSWSTRLEIELNGEPSERFREDEDQLESEWIATTLRRALGLPQG